MKNSKAKEKKAEKNTLLISREEQKENSQYEIYCGELM